MQKLTAQGKQQSAVNKECAGMQLVSETENQNNTGRNIREINTKEILWTVSSLPIGTKVCTRAGEYGVVKKHRDNATEIMRLTGGTFYIAPHSFVYRIGVGVICL
jgi:hypothetical protein